jgi:crotonobetainyl-CoA:carnitine CoA-transferase CaiB-like acyl-CoA transferase
MVADLPYAGLKVFDATQGVAGPHCALLLAQHGADVIKVEPLTGDWGRALGKTFGDHCAHSIAFNRGKRSIALDLKHKEALAIAKRLASEADAVLESYRPGVMDRLGLGYEAVRGDNPGVVYLSVTGYGQQGPYRDRPVTDSVIQAFSGWMSINRDHAGTPQRISIIAIDVMTGLYAFQAVAPALYRKALKGTGCYLDISLMQAAAAFQAAKIVEYQLEGSEPQVLGVPVGTFKAQDGYININARRQGHYEALCAWLGRPELASDPRFATVAARFQHEATLMAILKPLIESHTVAALVKACEEGDILHAPVATYGDLMADAQVKAVGAIPWLDHSGVGAIPMPNIPGTPALGPTSPMAHSPHLGQHTRDVLRGLGYRDPDIDALAAAKVIGLGPA